MQIPPSLSINWLEGLIELSKKLIVTAYYRQRIQIKISHGKRHVGQRSGKKQVMDLLSVFLHGIWTAWVPRHRCMRYTQGISNREDHLVFGVYEAFVWTPSYWHNGWSTWMTPAFSPTEGWADAIWGKAPSKSHCYHLEVPRPRHSYQSGYLFQGLRGLFSELRAKSDLTWDRLTSLSYSKPQILLKTTKEAEVQNLKVLSLLST